MPTLTTVDITAVTLSPNPVNINSALKISVTAKENTITLQPEITYSGDFYSGENYSQGG